MVIFTSLLNYKKPKGSVWMLQSIFNYDLPLFSNPIAVTHAKERRLLELLLLASEVFRVISRLVNLRGLVLLFKADVERPLL